MRKVIFSHFPKTAGTSVRWHLDLVLPPGPRIAIHHGPGGIPAETRADADVPEDWVLLIGHLRPRAIRANPAVAPEDDGIVFFAVLRDPVERILSLFNHVPANPDQPSHAQMQAVPPEAFTLAQPQDYQTDRLATLREKAWQAVSTEVGSLPAGLAALAEVAALPDAEAVAAVNLQVNMTPPSPGAVTRNDLPPQRIEAVPARHARDRALLDAVGASGGALTDLSAV